MTTAMLEWEAEEVQLELEVEQLRFEGAGVGDRECEAVSSTCIQAEA